MEQGPVEEKIMEQCLREGLPFPDKIANAPNLLQGLELYYHAFNDLSDSRQMGMEMGPIPWKVVHDYCVSYGIDGDQKEEMHYHIKQLDSAFLDFHKKKVKK